ncbi:ATPase [Mycobacterium colombiense]|uniref:ATPase n=1 Tax=Mycobacterium colombiense TaxID=339268 RepID=A0A1A2YR15_9MYCO|nr:ATPase [Mycobacterium colombiense]
MIGAERRQDGRVGVRRGYGGDLRRARPRAEAGRAAVNYENIVGLVLSIVIALYLGGALLFPERF